MTQTLHLRIHPLKLPPVIHPPDSLVDTDLDNTEPCGAFTFDDSTLEHLQDAYPPLTLSTTIMCLNTLPPIMGLLLIGVPMVAMLAQM